MIDKLKNRIFKKALEANAKIILPEVNDFRIKAALNELSEKGFDIVNISEYDFKISDYIHKVSKLKFTQNWTKLQLEKYLSIPLNQGMALVANGKADCLVAGAATSTADLIRSALRMIGLKPDSKWLSSIFLMISAKRESAYTFSDCAVIPEPTPEQLAIIAKDAAEFHTLLTGEEPRVAFLSFSTKGSANHYRVDRVRQAVSIFGEKFPSIKHDGELQLDTALNSEVSKGKIGNSTLNGNANVLVFPNLDAGNIGYKIAQQLGGFLAWGPLLQGLNKPIHDLSRGCSVDDIINVTSIAAMQSGSCANI